MASRLCVVAAVLDEDASAEVVRFRRRVQPLNEAVRRAPNDRPHLTLSAANADPRRVTAVAHDLAATRKPFRLTLNRVGVFSAAGVLWLGPRRSESLATLHHDVWQILLDHGWPPAFAGQSDPASWVPHCTIARRATRELADLVRVDFTPIRARVTGFSVIVVGDGEFADLPFGAG